MIRLFLIGILFHSTAAAGQEKVFKNKRYLMAFEDTTIAENRAYCQARGMTLALIRSEEENNFIKNHFAFDFTRIGAVWKQSTRTWTWDDGSHVTYTNWNDKQFCEESEIYESIFVQSRCSCTVEMDSSGKWRIFNCRSKAQALCEKVLNVPVTTESTQSDKENESEIPTTPIISLNETLISSLNQSLINTINSSLINTINSSLINTINSSLINTINSSLINFLNESLIAHKVESETKIASIMAKLTNVTNLLEGMEEKMKNVTFKVENRTNHVKDHVNNHLTKLNESLNKTNEGIRTVKTVFATIAPLVFNQSNHRVDSLERAVDELTNQLDTIRNSSNHLSMDESRMMRMIFQLEDEKDDMNQKVNENETSVISLNKKFFSSIIILILLHISLIFYVGYKYYGRKRQFNYSQQNHDNDL